MPSDVPLRDAPPYYSSESDAAPPPTPLREGGGSIVTPISGGLLEVGAGPPSLCFSGMIHHLVAFMMRYSNEKDNKVTQRPPSP